MSDRAEQLDQLEQLLRTWLDDDDACDVAGWIISEPEAVSQAAYDHYSKGRARDVTE